jgi:hypothetical protein
MPVLIPAHAAVNKTDLDISFRGFTLGAKRAEAMVNQCTADTEFRRPDKMFWRFRHLQVSLKGSIQ